MNSISPLPTVRRLKSLRSIAPPIAAACLLLACGESNNVIDRQEIDRAQLVQMRQEILALVDDRSCSEPSDCKQIGLGCKPCGGPWEFLIYSAPKVDETLLRDRVDAYSAAEREYNIKHGVLSDCALVAPGVPACVDGRCIDLGGGSRLAGAR